MYSAWQSTAALRLLGSARDAGAPTGGGEGREHIVSPRAQLVYGVSLKIPTIAFMIILQICYKLLLLLLYYYCYYY